MDFVPPFKAYVIYGWPLMKDHVCTLIGKTLGIMEILF